MAPGEPAGSIELPWGELRQILTDGKKRPDIWAEVLALTAEPANARGLHDVHGNVWEWCQNWCDIYQNAEIGSSARGVYGMLGRGSWYSRADNAHSEHRLVDRPSDTSGNLGFRLVLPPVAVPEHA